MSLKSVYIAYTPLILAVHGIPFFFHFRIDASKKNHHVFCIKASTMRLDHATLEAETGAEVQPCCESRGWEEMNFERSVNLRGRNSIQELDWYSKSFQLWEPYGGGPKMNVPANFHAMGLTTLASLERYSGVAGSSLHMATPTAVSRVGDFVAWLKKTSRHHHDISRTASVHDLRGAASGVHLCWPSSHRMTNWGAPEWIFWIQQVVELVVVRQLDNVC